MVLRAFANIKLLFLDVDGVLTDGTVLVTEQGEQLRSFSIKDGYAIQLAVKRGLHIVIISGGKSNGVLHRLNGLGVPAVSSDAAGELTMARAVVRRERVTCSGTVLMGYDIPERACFQQVGAPLCPQRAVGETQAVADSITAKWA